ITTWYYPVTMTAKPTSLSLNPNDQTLLEFLREKTGIRSTTEVVRYAIRQASGAPVQTPDTSRVAALEGALEAHRKALRLWSPADFEGVRAKAAAEESLRGL